MANTFLIDRTYVVTADDDGNTLVLGDVSDGCTGAWMVGFINDNTFTGTVDPVVRPRGPDASTNSVDFVGNAPYRKVYLNGAAGDGSLVTTQITTTSMIVVPVPGMSLGLTIACSSGSATLYTWPIEGASAY